jgi:hypothetical protein
MVNPKTIMRFTCLFACCLLLFAACKKNSQSTKGGVNLHLLTSFDVKIDTTTYPATYSIINPVADPVPFVSNSDIIAYGRNETTFYLKKNIKPLIKDFGGNKAFVVTVDGTPVYYGRFHPSYYSSIVFGIATIDPMIFPNEKSLRIDFAKMTAPAVTDPLDKRNDPLIIAWMAMSQRLR